MDQVDVVRTEGILSADLDPAEEVGQEFLPKLGEPSAMCCGDLL